MASHPSNRLRRTNAALAANPLAGTPPPRTRDALRAPEVTDASGAPHGADVAPWSRPVYALRPSSRAPAQPFELALEDGPPFRVRTLAVRVEDKQLFDELGAWWMWRSGEKHRQWEMFTVVLAEALAAEGGRFAGFESAS